MTDPFKKFNSWFRLAKNKFNGDHTAFALGTVDKFGKPHVRMVLLKKVDKDGLVFFTNFESNKGEQFKFNSNLSMCFYWNNLDKQIRIEGSGKTLTNADSDKYFISRNRGSQIGAWASNQSRIIKSRDELKQKINFFEKKFKNLNLPRPKNWGGIKIYPNRFEFWTAGKFRIHKREVYQLYLKKWKTKILSP